MERFYHIHHPFHIAMNEGGLDADAVRGCTGCGKHKLEQ